MIDRRHLLTGLGASALACRPLAAQAADLPLVGFVNSQSMKGWEHFVAAFERGLESEGFKARQSVEIAYGWADGDPKRLPPLIADLIARRPAVLVVTGGPDPALAAKAATTSIPVVFTTGADPVALGLVESLSRPGGNFTGFTLFTRELNPKRLELLGQLSPKGAAVAALFNPSNTGAHPQLEALRRSVDQSAAQILPVWVSHVDGLEPGLRAAQAAGARSIFVSSDPYFYANRSRLIEVIDALGLPAIYEGRDFVTDGGLISYGVDFASVYRRAGAFAGRILKGTKPADIPVEQPSRMELLVNSRAARKLGVAVPSSILIRADEVIE